MKGLIHVFFGTFSARAQAALYTEPQWAPEPDEAVSDAVYQQ